MANNSVCAELKKGFNLDCNRNIAKKYLQEAVFINFNDVDRTNSKLNVLDEVDCKYSVEMLLLPGKKGVLFKLRDNMTSIKGSYDKSKNDYGFPEYLHKVQALASSTDEESKCILDSLDHGLYVVVLKFSNGVQEVYGWENGISTGDYTSDPQETGGLIIVPLQSDEKAKENYLPMVYKSKTPGSEAADFDKLFEQPAA